LRAASNLGSLALFQNTCDEEVYCGCGLCLPWLGLNNLAHVSYTEEDDIGIGKRETTISWF
jgi:hypothetical protein